MTYFHLAARAVEDASDKWHIETLNIHNGPAVPVIVLTTVIFFALAAAVRLPPPPQLTRSHH